MGLSITKFCKSCRKHISPFAGRAVYVRKREELAALRRLRAEGVPPNKLAETFGVTPRHIYRLLATR